MIRNSKRENRTGYYVEISRDISQEFSWDFPGQKYREFPRKINVSGKLAGIYWEILV